MSFTPAIDELLQSDAGRHDFGAQWPTAEFRNLFNILNEREESISIHQRGFTAWVMLRPRIKNKLKSLCDMCVKSLSDAALRDKEIPLLNELMVEIERRYSSFGKTDMSSCDMEQTPAQHQENGPRSDPARIFNADGALATTQLDAKPKAKRNHTRVAITQAQAATLCAVSPVCHGISASVWGEIHIVFVNVEAIEIHCNGIVQNKTFDELGFSDNRKNDVPNSQWELLKHFAKERGEIRSDNDITKRVSALRKGLKSLFPSIHSDPIPFDKKIRAYKTVFNISSRIPREE